MARRGRSAARREFNLQIREDGLANTGRRRLYLMRHGHVDYFAPGLTDPRLAELTPEGVRQAQAARDALRHVAFEFAACSGLIRTRLTAEIVLAANAGDPQLLDLPGLEELRSGWLRAQSREELAARLAFCFDGAESPGACFLPDGETFAAAQARIIDALEQSLFTHRWSRGLIVAHEGVNRIILGWATGGGLKTIAAFEQDLGCVNVVDFDVTPAMDGKGLKIERALVKSLNLTPYDFVKDGLPRTSLEHLFGVDFGASRPPAKPVGGEGLS